MKIGVILTDKNNHSAKRSKTWFYKGVIAAVPFVLVLVPFGMVFGAVATKAGFSLLETMTMTIVVIAGASQFTAVALLEQNIPTIMIILVAVAVNLRMAMYSASMTLHIGKASLLQRMMVAYYLVDQAYAASLLQYEKQPEMSVLEKVRYFLGLGVVMSLSWYTATLFGALVGEQIPESYPIDFFVPAAFIAVIAPMMRKIPHLVAAFVSIVVGLCCAGLPYQMGLFIAAFAAMVAGAQTELWLERKAATLLAEEASV